MTGPVDADAVLWHAVRSEALLWADWGGDHVVFHRPSGLTHLVNPATADLLRHVLQKPCSMAEAASALARWQGAEAGPDYAVHVGELIARLAEVGLVERAGARATGR